VLVLVDVKALVYESVIINAYLEEECPEVPLMPKHQLGRARVRMWVDYCNTRLQYARRDIAHDFEVEKSTEQLKRYLATLDEEMRGREYIAGDYSVADITYIPFFVRKERYKAVIDDSLPHLKAWMDRLLSRPTVRATP